MFIIDSKHNVGKISDGYGRLLKLMNTLEIKLLHKSRQLLNLGCGTHVHSDWINVDFRETGPGVIVCNLMSSFPFPDKAFDVVYHSHLLEHFPKWYAPDFLKECFRVLKPKGVIRVAVPDLEAIVRLYLDALEHSITGDNNAKLRYEWIMLELFDQMVRSESGGEMLRYWQQNTMPAEEFVVQRVGLEVVSVLEQLRANPRQQEPVKSFEELSPESLGSFRLSGEVHQWMYDRYSLRALLQNAGFNDVHRCHADESLIPDFNSYLLDIQEDGSIRKPDSLFMEAIKP